MTMNYVQDVVVLSEQSNGADGDLGAMQFYAINSVESTDTVNDPPPPSDLVGILGVTPQSVLDPMGIFNQLQGKSTGYVPYMGLYVTNDNGLVTLGGYDEDLVKTINSINFYDTTNSSQWQIQIKSLQLNSPSHTVYENKNGDFY